MKLRHLFLAVLCFALLSGCQKAEETSRFIMPDVVVAISPFTQPTQTSDLLSGFIPEGQKEVSAKKLAELDTLFHSKLHSSCTSSSSSLRPISTALWLRTNAAAAMPLLPGPSAP